MAAGPSTRSAGDEQAGHLRGRRCEVGQREAGRVGRGRGLGVRSAHPPGAARGVAKLGAPKWPPKPPSLRSAPAQPGRSSIEHGGPEMAPKPPNVRSGPAQPGRSSKPPDDPTGSWFAPRGSALSADCVFLLKNGRLGTYTAAPALATGTEDRQLAPSCIFPRDLDRGMSLGLAVVGIAPTPSMFAPASTPAFAIRELSFLLRPAARGHAPHRDRTLAGRLRPLGGGAAGGSRRRS